MRTSARGLAFFLFLLSAQAKARPPWLTLLAPSTLMYFSKNTREKTGMVASQHS